MKDAPKILAVNVSDSSGGAARAAFRIHSAVNQYGGNSRMFVKNKMLQDDTILDVQQFNQPNQIIRLLRFLIKKIKNQIQHYRWGKYPDKEDVFMSDLRSESIHGAFQKIDFDILHLHWINLRFLDLKELQKVNKPIVWTLHDCWPFTGVCHYFYDCEKYLNSCGTCHFLHSDIENDLSRKIIKKKEKIYKGLDMHIVAPSRWLAEAAKRSNLFRNFPVTVIPNPIDTALFTSRDKLETCKLLALDPEKKYILFGAMDAVKDKNKGFYELINALKYFIGTYDYKDIVLLVFGTNEPINDLKLEIPVNYLGLIENDNKMVAAYTAASVMVVPSLSENLSNTIMESLSCGTPVTAFNIGGNGDMIDHFQNGYLAKPFSVEDLATGIKWCLDNNVDNYLSIKARKKVEENFDMYIVAGKYIDLFKSINI